MKTEDQKRYQEIKASVKELLHALRKQIAANKFARMPVSTLTDMQWLVRLVEGFGDAKTAEDKKFQDIQGRADDLRESLEDEAVPDRIIRVAAEVITEMDWLVKKINELDRQKAA